MSEALYRKYRPATFGELTDQEHVKVTLRNQVEGGSVAHAYVFTGPRGVGKTTVARILAKAVNCLKGKAGEPCNTCEACLEILEGRSLDVYEMDAASHTDVENVRENIIKSVRFAPNKLKFKVYIIDEVHMLSTSSFNALLKTLEEPPAHALFVLATTEVHKVPATILSRCQRFDFRRIPVSALVKRLSSIAKEEGVQVSEDVLAEVARHADGCARDAETLLGQLFALGEKKLTMAEAQLVLPATTHVMVADFLEALVRRDAAGAVRKVNDLVEQGIDLPYFMDDLVEALRVLLFAKLGVMDQIAEHFESGAAKRMQALLSSVEAGWITKVVELLMETRRRMKTDKIPQLGLELAAVNICQPENFLKQEAGLRLEKKDEILPLTKGKLPAAQATIASAGGPASPAKLGGVEGVAAEVAPVEVKTIVFDSVPVVNLDDVKTKWPEVFEQIKACNASLPIVIQAGEIEKVEGDAVEFTFEYALHAETVNRDQNRRLLEDILARVLGKRLRVHAHYAHADADETVTNLLQNFGGNVV